MSTVKKSTTKYIAAAVLIIIVLAGAGYYFYTSSTSTMTSTSAMSSESMVSSATSSAAPAFKDTIIIGTTDTVQTTLDPADAYDYFAQDVIMVNIADGLVDYVPGTTSFAPALATSWTTSSDGLTWTFNLRDGVKFADGTPFDANVVKYSIDREFAIDESSGPFAGVGIDTLINKTVVVSPTQVQFVLNHPFGAFLAIVAFQAMWPVNPNVAPMHSIVNYTGDVKTEVPTNIGAYMLTAWQRTGGKDVEIDLTANPNYWNASSGNPKTKNIIIKIYSDATSLNLAMQSGAIDIAYRQLSPTDIKSYQTNANFKYWEGPGSFIQYLCFNEKSPPFDKVAVRQAVAAALDRSLITNTVFLGQVEPLYSMVPIGMAYHQDSFKVYGDANVTGATALLQSAGYSTSNPLKFTLTYPTGHYSSTDGISSAIKQALEKTGLVQVTLASQPWANYKASTQSDALQAYIYGWYPDFVDPYDYTQPFLPADGRGFLNTHYVNPDMTAMIKTVGTSTDTSVLASTYASIQQLTATDAPIVPLFQGKTTAVSNLKVGGMILDETIWFRAYLMWETT
jgi:peptide/nickel transport system substrate-binding protein